MTTTQVSPIVLPLQAARSIIDAGIDKATELGIPYTLAVLDGSGNLVAHARMDGAALASIDTSIAKARTSAYFGAATADLQAGVQPGAPLFTIQTSTAAALAFVAGAVPITDADGVVIGAVGAGGGTPDQDHVVALAAKSAV
ncbi:GlcG/HbpS family heme-binding protein [Herbiconiux daphne]|uniref:Heme-binding protein n=1 Tax=Herbiconiux daphne TaxID=2970914 RepID=A0ABT2GY93_9MICO|nr:heme-binding protein [Herbiconiux daphne]MCS5732883.1 heme-binding protein [Herbiconiux daphne]